MIASEQILRNSVLIVDSHAYLKILSPVLQISYSKSTKTTGKCLVNELIYQKT